jgi:hypothetical protein
MKKRSIFLALFLLATPAFAQDAADAFIDANDGGNLV